MIGTLGCFSHCAGHADFAPIAFGLAQQLNSIVMLLLRLPADFISAP